MDSNSELRAQTRGLAVGEAASRSGLTVRSLHHYEACGLLGTVARTATGRRLYNAEGLRRLDKIRMLRGLGLGLDAIRSCLEGKASSPLECLKNQLSELHTQIAEMSQKAEELHDLVTMIESGEDDLSRGVPQENFSYAIDLMMARARYFSPEEIEDLRGRARELGVAGLRDKRREGQALLARLRSAMQAAQNPGDAKVVELGERWRDFTAECRTHGMGSGAANAAMLASEPGLAEATARRLGIDVELLGYIGRVFDHLDWGTAEDADA